MLKRNLAANFIGQGWVALMGLLFIPLYIHYLGIEAYGLIGLFAVIQAWLALLDMGMTPTLSREMARFTAGEHSGQSIRDLLRSIEIIVAGIALLIAVGIWLAAEWLASDWLQAETLPLPIVVQAFAIMGVVTALRFVENIYRSTVVGLQQQVLLNLINAIMATLRGVGAVVILVWFSATIQAFFIWQGFISITTVVVLVIATYQAIPEKQLCGHFSFLALSNVGRFAGGMMGITFLSLLLTQIDKILLAKLLPLSEYGYYALAFAVAAILYQFIGPITQAFYPRLCELQAKGETEQFYEAYHKGAQLVTVVAGSAALVGILFADTLLRLWTQDEALVDRTATLLSVLMLGNLLNGLMWIPYQAQLAYGWTSYTFWVNVVSVFIIVPAVWWFTPVYGAVGAAWIWVALNAGYVFIGIHFMYRRILITEKWYWYWFDIFIPLSAGLATVSVIKWLFPETEGIIMQLSKLVISSIVTLLVVAVSTKYTRVIVWNYCKRFRVLEK